MKNHMLLGLWKADKELGATFLVNSVRIVQIKA